MLREAEKRFWMNSLEKMCRQQEKNMLSKKQIAKKIDDLAKVKVLDVLQELDTKGAKKFKDNFPLHCAKNELKKDWYNIFRDWSIRAKAVSNIVPEKEIELFGIIGELQFKALIEARENYNKELNRFSAKETRKKLVSFIYTKNIKKRVGRNVLFLTQNNFFRKVAKAKICIEMPYEIMKTKFRKKGFIKGDHPASNLILSTQNSVSIIGYYLKLAREIMNFYRCADNKWQVVKLINWHLRYSLLKTLAQKYSVSVSKMIAKFSITPSVWTSSKQDAKKLVPIVSYISPLEINTMKKKFLVSDLDMTSEDLKKCLDVIRIKTSKYLHLWAKCAVRDCSNFNIEMHHVRILARKLKSNIVTVKIDKNEKFFTADIFTYSNFVNALMRKQISLCLYHYNLTHSDSLDSKDLNLEFTNFNLLYANGDLESVISYV